MHMHLFDIFIAPPLAKADKKRNPPLSAKVRGSQPESGRFCYFLKRTASLCFAQQAPTLGFMALT